MVAPIRKTVTVGPDGLIELRASGLLPGSRADVIVLQHSAAKVEGDPFFANLSLDELAKQQGVSTPVTFEQLLGGWPDTERQDGFERAVARWRRADAIKSKRAQKR